MCVCVCVCLCVCACVCEVLCFLFVVGGGGGGGGGFFGGGGQRGALPSLKPFPPPPIEKFLKFHKQKQSLKNHKFIAALIIVLVIEAHLVSHLSSV